MLSAAVSAANAQQWRVYRVWRSRCTWKEPISFITDTRDEAKTAGIRQGCLFWLITWLALIQPTPRSHVPQTENNDFWWDVFFLQINRYTGFLLT